MAAIAHKAGVNKAMINYHFGGKGVLVQRRPEARPPDAAAYVKHVQDLLTHGLAAQGPKRAQGPSQRRRS